MKRALYILSMLLLAASCEIPFDLDQSTEPQIYLQAIAKGTHVQIIPLVANPVSGAPAADAPLDIHVEVNGESIPVRAQDSISYIAHIPGPRWKLEEEDEISVTVRSGSLPPVSGSTHFPKPLVIEDFSWEPMQVDTLKAVKVSVKLDHEPGDEEYYGIRIHRQEHLIFPDDFYKQVYRSVYDGYITPGYVLTLADIGRLDLENFVQVNYDGRFLGGRNSQPLTLLTKKQFKGDTYQFYLNSYDTAILNGIREGSERNTETAGGGNAKGEKDASASGQGQGGQKANAIGRRTTYNIELYRLSPEFYLFSKALFQSSFDFLSNMGLVPANFTWSNVKGGLGFVGALSSSNLEPIVITEDFQK